MNHKGVTLIELIVVFVIIAIMASLLVPGIGAWLPSYRLRTATRDIASTFRGAQMRAISECVPYTVSFNSAETSVPNNTGYAYAGIVRNLPPGITVVSNTLQDFRAVFNTDSTCALGAATSASITLQNARGSRRSITISSATGRLTIQ